MFGGAPQVHAELRSGEHLSQGRRTPSNLLWHLVRDTKSVSIKKFMINIHIAVTQVT